MKFFLSAKNKEETSFSHSEIWIEVGLVQTGQTFPHLPLLSPSKWGSPGPNVRGVSPGLKGDASILARVRSPPDFQISSRFPNKPDSCCLVRGAGGNRGVVNGIVLSLLETSRGAEK